MIRAAYICADIGVPVFGRKGSSIHVQEVLRALHRRGVAVELFAARGEGPRPPGLETVPLHHLPLPPKGEPAAREQAALKGNSVLYDELSVAAPFDFIYERYSLWSFAAMAFARDRGRPALLEVNAPLVEEQAGYRTLVDRAAAERTAETAFASASALLAVSAGVADYLDRFPAACGKVHIVPNGVDASRFSEQCRPALPAAPGVFTVGFVGTLKPWHGLAAMLEAFALLHARHPAIRLLIVGEGPEAASLNAATRARNLQSVTHFAGGVDPTEVPALLASMDVGVAPYPDLPRFYFSPLKVFEYMAAGLPVVASRIGQLTEVVESGVTGLLTPPGDIEALAAGLEQLLRNPELRRRLGTEGRARVLARYSWDKVAQRILQLAKLHHNDGLRRNIEAELA